uniref:Secreted protein n=1 Tax=Globodera pallida TaxID=36090 RepID=A0A183CB93_GLOPA
MLILCLTFFLTLQFPEPTETAVAHVALKVAGSPAGKMALNAMVPGAGNVLGVAAKHPGMVKKLVRV